MRKKGQARLRLVTSEGKRLDGSRDSASPLHGQVSKSELASGERFDLPSTPLGDFLLPHADSLASDAESISKSLVSAAPRPTPKMIENFLKTDLAHQRTSGSDSRSVSTLPRTVKRLTYGSNRAASKLAYMKAKRRVPTDEWAIKRGAAMKAARSALGKSQLQIAEIVGVTREAISQFESGLIEEIDTKLIPKLAMALGMPAQQLSRIWKGKDESESLRVSPVARQIAMSFDAYPLMIQNEIRQAVSKYEALVKQYGKEAADTMYTPVEGRPPPTKVESKRRRTSSH